MSKRTELPFFEGAEKKIEFAVRPSRRSLRELGDSWWTRIVETADARILSRISNGHCDAFLLSESSLFVWDNKALMITCGRTRLTDAALAVLDEFPPEDLAMFAYERKNEVLPHEQATSFYEDIDRLGRRLPGRAYQFGDEGAHHLYLFHLDRAYDLEPEDATVEILMYGLDDAVRSRFELTSPPDGRRLCERVGLDRILPGFDIDDHQFEPRGYSLNAIRDDRYLTVHVTPDEISSYASLETNARLGDDLSDLLDRVVGFFQPRSFDLITWERGQVSDARHGEFRVRSCVEQELSCGYRVRFTSLYRPQPRVGSAIELPLPEAQPPRRTG